MIVYRPLVDMPNTTSSHNQGPGVIDQCKQTYAFAYQVTGRRLIGLAILTAV